MILLSFIFYFSKSSPSLSLPGYYSVDLQRDEQLELFLSNGNFDCILIWSHTADNDASITVFKDDKSKNYNFIGETTAIVKGDKALISVSSKTTVHAWIIKKDICNMHSLLFTTPHFIKDNFQVEKDVDNLCLFFSNHNNQTKISFKSSNDNGLSKISVFSESSPVNVVFSGKKLLAKQFNYHFFIQIAKPNGMLNLEFEIAGEEPKNTLCDHLPIHMITIDGEVERNVIRETEISCTKEEIKNTSIIPFISILVVFILIIIIAGIVYQTGYYKRIIAWKRGEIIRDGPAKVEIDPKEILRIDDIEDELDDAKNDQENTNQDKEKENNGSS